MSAYPIDIVVAWVDGDDPAWRAERAKYRPEVNTDNNDARYREWGVFQYWFRRIEEYAPWVRTVHLLTWGHLPPWLNTEHPKLHIVNHKDYIPAEYLPTFSSHTIEMNIHRIPDLAEHFIYFNDDMFLLRPHTPEDFFWAGLPCTCGREVPWTFHGNVGIWEHAAANDLGVINAHFPKKAAMAHHGKKFYSKCYGWKNNLRTFMLNTLFPDFFTGFENLHAPGAYLKKTFEEVWAAEPQLLDSTCRDRFRTAANVNQWVCLWWQVASGNFEPAIVDNVVAGVTEGNVESLCRIIENQNHDYICINDPEEDVDVEDLSARLKKAFETILPEKSSFEI